MMPFSLLKWRTNYFVKRDKNTILVHGIHDVLPLTALNFLTQATMKKFCMRQDQNKKWSAKDYYNYLGAVYLEERISSFVSI